MTRETIGRRRFIQSTGAAATAMALAGCSGSDDGGGGGGDGTPPSDEVEAADSIQFITESTAPSQALQSIVGDFTQETGIDVEFTLSPLLNYTEQLANDLTSESANYDAAYVDPYNIGAPYYTDLEPLNGYIEQNDYDYEDHIEIHRVACSEFEDDGTIRGLPYDCPTILLAYRQDVFDEYGDQATSDLGFEAEPNPDMTWSQYIDVARWITENVPDDLVPHGTGHMAAQHQSLANEFEMIQWSFGGTQLEGFNGKDPILPDDLSPGFTDDASIQAAEYYRELVNEVAHPASSTWDWGGVAQAFANGEMAMSPQWHENSGLFTDPESSEIADTVRWTLAPSGPAENQNVQAHYGGSSIGINAHTTPEKKKAAWQFIEWATSEEIQYRLLSEVGGTPTRQSVYEREDVQAASEQTAGESEYPNVAPPIIEGWQLDNVGQRPHHPDWLQLEEVIYSEGSAMVSGDQSVEATMQNCADGFSNIL